MLLTVEQYPQTPVYDLLTAASRGQIGLDQRWLRSIVDRGQAAVPDLLRYAQEEHDDQPINLEEDLISIFRYLKTPDALPFFIKCIRQEPEEVSDELVEALHEIGQPAIDPLLELYGELEEDQASDIAFLLASLRIRDGRILKILLDHLDFDLGDGALCLGLYGDPEGKPALERALADLDPKSREQETLRRELSTALEQIDQQRDEHVVGAFHIWELYPEESAPEFDLLDEDTRLELLQSSDAAIRAEAAASFFNRDLSTDQRVTLLKTAQNDTDLRVRARCWEALGTQTEVPDVRTALLKVIADSKLSAEERSGALVALAPEIDNPIVLEQVLALYEISETRAKALEAMWRSMDRSFQEYFPKHLDDADEEVKRQAIWGVGYFGLSTESGRLQALFADAELRADALFAFALATPGEISRGRAKTFLKKIDQLAGGLSVGETELVQLALDERLALHGHEPVFFPDEAKEEASVAIERGATEKVGRNDPCPCGSGQKYKKCHGQ